MGNTDNLEYKSSIIYAILGGFASSIVGAIIWAGFTVITEIQIGVVALGLGFLTGFSVRYFGQGMSSSYRVVGAFFSFFSCLLGNLFTQIGFIALENQEIVFKTIAIVDYPYLFKWIFQNTDPIDVLFYAIAAYEGYKFSVNKFAEKADSKDLHTRFEIDIKTYPIKKQIYIFTFYIVMAIIGVYSISTVNSFRTYYYSSGEKQCEGKERKGLCDGLWSYWYEDGSLMAEINYKIGFEEGPMKYFYEDGSIFSESNYVKAMMHGEYIEYFSNSKKSVEGSYNYNRKTGIWKYFYENGSIYQKGIYNLDLLDGNWQTYYENGKLMEEGKYKNGIKTGIWIYYSESGEKTLEERYEKNEEVQILNYWDSEHNQLVKNGNGVFKQYHENGLIALEVNIKNNNMNGTCLQWYDDGKPLSNTEYRDGESKLINYWLSDGKQAVTDGKGHILLYHDNGQLHVDIKYVDGNQSGFFNSYWEDGSINVACEYLDGELHGDYVQYNESGLKIIQGKYSQGKRNELWEWWDESDGTLSSSVTFIDDKKEGIQEFWIYNEKVKEEIYRNGKLEEVIPYL